MMVLHPHFYQWHKPVNFHTFPSIWLKDLFLTVSIYKLQSSIYADLVKKNEVTESIYSVIVSESRVTFTGFRILSCQCLSAGTLKWSETPINTSEPDSLSHCTHIVHQLGWELCCSIYASDFWLNLISVKLALAYGPVFSSEKANCMQREYN